MNPKPSTALLALTGLGFITFSAWPAEPVWPRVLDGARLELQSGRQVGLAGVADRGDSGRTHLHRLIAGRETALRCEEQGWDGAARRPLAVCWVGSEELNAAMIGQGFAARPVREAAIRREGF
jgi:hypothetical protein